ncbi:MAG: heavy metal-associated domain-containing protein [Patescibacteria group bacterium]
MIIKKKFKIDGMHCTSCCLNIDFDLEDLNGVSSAKTSYTRQECEVEFDEKKIRITDIITQIKNTGYQAKIKN